MEQGYLTRRSEIQTYFDRTAAETWQRLTSDAPVSKIRATVRAGRQEMRRTILSWLPRDLTGRRVLDAGCGTGAMAAELAGRGAEVVAVDVACSLVETAAERAPKALPGRIDWRVGDMLDDGLGHFDHIVAMDSLIHYATPDMVRALGRLSERSSRSMIVTFAPRTPLLAAMHMAGRLFPRSDRAPAIVPVPARRLAHLITTAPDLANWRADRTHRIDSGFYMSQALEVARS
ncbi:MAG: magnesium protoporphyrin IX methyltransferase [Pseudomonadota bacterium]